jgi:hypothetical protein
MRILLLVLVAVALATSGCFGKDDGEGDPVVTSPTTPTPTTPTDATPTTPTVNTTPEPPAPPPARDVCTVAFTYSNNAQPGPPPTEVTNADCGTVAAGYTQLTLNVTFNPVQASPVYVIGPTPINVVVLDSAGTAVLTCPGPAAGAAAPVPCSQSAAAAPGAYTLQFNGAGNVEVAGTVTAT